MPRCENFDRTSSPVSCSLCADNRFRNDRCLVDNHPLHGRYPGFEVVRWLISQLD